MAVIDFRKLDKLKDEKVDIKKVSTIASEILTPDKKRDESEKQHFHWLKICLIWFMGISFTAIAFVVVYHLITPESWRWLKVAEIANLEKMFVTGIGAALIGKFGNKLVD